MLVAIIGNTELTWPTTCAAVLFVIMSYHLFPLDSILNPPSYFYPHCYPHQFVQWTQWTVSLATVRREILVGWWSSYRVSTILLLYGLLDFCISYDSRGILYYVDLSSTPKYLPYCTCIPSLHLKIWKMSVVSNTTQFRLLIITCNFDENIYRANSSKYSQFKFDIKFNIHYFCFEIVF